MEAIDVITESVKDARTVRSDILILVLRRNGILKPKQNANAEPLNPEP